MDAGTIYKLVTLQEWEAARAEGVFRGSEHDRLDGYIHLSTAAQLSETAEKHYSGITDLVLLAVDTEMLARLHASHPSGEAVAATSLPGGEERGEGRAALRWEPARGGDLFPHLYANLPLAAVQDAIPIPLSDDGMPVIPSDLPS